MATTIIPVMLLSAVLSATYPAESEDMQNRLGRLESQTNELRSSVQAYHREIERLPPVDAIPVSSLETVSALSDVPNATSLKSSPTEFTDAELKGALQKLAWSKGPFTFTPYGRLWTTTSYDTHRTSPGDYVLWVESPDLKTGSEFHVDARSTRLGMDVAGPAVDCLGDAKVGGKVEIDFQGVSLQDNKGGVLFRHAYVDIKNDDYRLLFGQTWDVISPLYTPTFDYTVGSGAGNLAYRRAQFRAERFLTQSDSFLITLQSALAVEVIVPITSASTIRGDHAGWPDWQNRVAFTFGERKAKDAQPVEIGFSGHVGEQSFDVYPIVGPPILDVNRPTWSISVDMKVPITKTFGVQGELFTGSNLSNYYGGILQGIDPVTLNAIRDNGGWVDIWYDMRPDLHWNLGYSIDDPLNQDMTTGRTYNQYFYANFIHDFTEFLNAGLEVSSWKTLYIDRPAGEDIRIEVMARYNF